MKRFLACLFATIITLTLAGCGNKLTCTLEEEYDDTYEASSKSKVIVEFNDKDIAIKTTTTEEMTFDDADTAEAWYNLYKAFGSDDEEGVEVKLSGKTLSVTQVNEEFDEETTKEEAKTKLEDEGYTCK